jgi:ABC-type phosphate transport system substrate-binding protein
VGALRRHGSKILALAFMSMALGVAACGGGTGTGSAAASAAGSVFVAPVVTLDAPGSVAAGSDVEVSWTGATGSDYITIVPAGQPYTDGMVYTDVRDGNPAKIKAPGTAGQYEILCIQGDTLTVIKARRSLTVT